MITDRITALFKFIEFLHSNSKNFTQYNENVNELQTLLLERIQHSPYIPHQSNRSLQQRSFCHLQMQKPDFPAPQQQSDLLPGLH